MSGHAVSAGKMGRGAAARDLARTRARLPLLVAAACALALAIVWGVAEHVPAVQARDASALYHLTLLDRPSVESVGHTVLRLLEPLPFTLWSLILLALGLFAGRVRQAIAASVVLVLAPITAEVLKPLLAHPHDSVGGVHIGPASWPSGHATAALALVGAAYLIASPRRKPIVAGIGAAFAAAVGLLLLILAWHMPSDVLGGYLVAGLWTALAAAGLRAYERRRDVRRLARGVAEQTPLQHA